MPHRHVHYWLWFVIFGVVAGLLDYRQHQPFGSESLWLIAGGLLGILVTMKWLNQGKFARSYDLLVGVVFACAGIVGILANFGMHVWPHTGVLDGMLSRNFLFGLSLAALPSLIHTALGLTSINHGFKG